MKLAVIIMMDNPWIFITGFTLGVALTFFWMWRHNKKSFKCLTTQQIENIISKSALWKSQVKRPGLQRDKRQLAQEIRKVLEEI